MPRFVVLEHDWPELHWDLMLESGASLRTWRLSAPPRCGEAVNATAVFAHRMLYLDYEGPISGNRGRVIRWDHGSFDWQMQADDRVIVRLEGERLHGILRLEQVQADTWRGEFSNDGANS